jgi:hypothetical protein
MPKRKFLNTLKSISKLILPLTLFIIFLISYQHFFIIRQIVCQTNNESCPRNLSEELTTELGKSLLFFDRQSLNNKIIDQYGPTGLDIKPQFPGTLILNLNFSGSEIPVEFIETDFFSQEIINQEYLNLIETFIASNSSISKKLTTEGRLLDSSIKSNLYIITKNPDKTSLQNIAENLSILHQSAIIYQKAYLIPPNLIIINKNNQNIIFSLSKSIKPQILSLQQLERAATIRNSHFIDLRFNRPVTR